MSTRNPKVPPVNDMPWFWTAPDQRILRPIFDMYRLNPDAPHCGNCRAWEYRHPEADGRSLGQCRALSGKGWRYSHVPLADDEQLELYTRCDFGCVLFSQKPSRQGRIELDIEDEP